MKAADPTIVEAPNSPGHYPRFVTVSRTARRISGADDPRAISVRLATVAFQKVADFWMIFSPYLTLTITFLDVIFSIASMKISATIEIPRNKYIRANPYAKARKPLFNVATPGINNVLLQT